MVPRIHGFVLGWRGTLAAVLLAGCGSLPVCVRADPGAAPLGLCARIDAALAHALDARVLDAGVQGAWQVVHGILAFGPGFQIDVSGNATPALAHLLAGGTVEGWRLRPGPAGVVALVEEGSTLGQGHPDQWLGYLSQCGPTPNAGIPLDTPLEVAGRSYTVRDLLTQAQHDIRTGREATWTLMALAAWLPSEASWVAGDGARWTTERVVRMEAEADIFSAACGGAHRLYALAAALSARRQATGAEPTGGWAVAAAVVADCLERARRYQQPDGCFSAHSFERPGTTPDVFARLSATGHVFEVVAVALDDESLSDPWVVRAAERLVTLLDQTEDLDVECGALYHACHGLAIYRHRRCP